MRSPPTKFTFGLIGAILVVVALFGIVYEYAQQRTLMREHAAAAVGGDTRRGEAMFIQYGCGSCHALKSVRGATGSVGPPLDGIAVRAIIGGALGALMSFSSSPWYADYAAMGLTGIGLDPVADQQLAGLVMWIPGGLVHAAAALAMFYKWLKASEAAHALTLD